MKTQNQLFKLIWFVYPLTKLVYAYIAYSSHTEIDNSFQTLCLIFLLIGIASSCISMFLSKKIYKKSFYENKIVSTFLGNKASNREATTFTLFTMLLGLAESTALFGLVQYLMTGDLIRARVTDAREYDLVGVPEDELT